MLCTVTVRMRFAFSSLLTAPLSAPVHTGRPSQRLHRETPFPVSRTGHERPGIPDPGICPHPLTPLRYLSRRRGHRPSPHVGTSRPADCKPASPELSL